MWLEMLLKWLTVFETMREVREQWNYGKWFKGQVLRELSSGRPDTHAWGHFKEESVIEHMALTIFGSNKLSFFHFQRNVLVPQAINLLCIQKANKDLFIRQKCCSDIFNIDNIAFCWCFL